MTRIFGLLLIVSFVLTSCGSKADTNLRKQISSYDSYAFLPNKDTVQSSRFNNAAINEVVLQEISENMDNRNFRLNRSQPDLLVFYHLMLDEANAVDAAPAYTNYPYYRPGYYVGPYYENYAYTNYFTVPRLQGNTVNQINYKQGTVVVDIIDRRTNEILWRGSANQQINVSNPTPQLENIITTIFEDFPN